MRYEYEAYYEVCVNIQYGSKRMDWNVCWWDDSISTAMKIISAQCEITQTNLKCFISYIQQKFTGYTNIQQRKKKRKGLQGELAPKSRR